jgi:hypothetical protein
MLWNDAITAGFYDRRNGVGPSFCVATNTEAECPLWVIVRVMSALPPKADIADRDRHVRFVPKADSCSAAKSSLFDHFVGAPG